MLQFDLQFYEELTVARVKTVKFISGAFFGRQVSLFSFFLVMKAARSDNLLQSKIDCPSNMPGSRVYVTPWLWHD